MKRRFLATGLLTALAVSLLVAAPAAIPAQADTTGASAVTVSGTGRFSHLKVTVSQTEHLINQVVKLSWSGFDATTPTSGNFDASYLQVMQCWGDGPDAPKRENCQFGGQARDLRGGTWAATRQTSYGTTLVDPDETYVQPPGSFIPARVPFTSVTGKTTTDVDNEFYDAYSSNEIPFARSAANGTGTEFFEVQTAREAPGLGCGEALVNGPRSCWLVVVPRDTMEVDGSNAADTEARRLVSSPLSASNWKHRLTIPLHFDQIGLSCPIGAAERRLLGNEEVSEAVTRWQPALCGATGAIFGFSQIGDDLARAQTRQDTPWMSLVNRPLPADSLTDNRRVTYAPLSVSGLGIAFVIDRQPFSSASADEQKRRGTRVQRMKLNARLVAKLLTQSYVLATLAPPTLLKNNPRQLSEDPEFLKLNPEFKDLQFGALMSISVPLGLSDATSALWEWIRSDQAARAFVGGKADPWGTKVNPSYKAMSLDREDFPRSDSHCQKFGDGRPDLCTLDYLAYAADMHDAGRSAARGDTLSRALWDPSANPPSWKKAPPQLSGQRAVLALVDSATAARYQLPLASLRNASGHYVAPEDTSLSAGLKAMKETAVKGVLEGDPGTKDPAAYPLTSVTYGVTVPHLLGEDEAADYAGFLTYAAGPGQTPGVEPGRLPEGYVPLTAEQRKQTLAVAKLVKERAGPLPVTEDPTDGSGRGGGGGATGVDDPASTSGESEDAAAGPSTTPQAQAQAQAPTTTTAVALTTPSTPVGRSRLVLPLALMAALALVVARCGPPLWTQVQRRRRPGVL